MKIIIILLFLSFCIYSGTLEAQEFNMKILRLQERKLALNEFKKLYKERKHYKQQLYQRAKYKRSKKIKKNSVLNTNRGHGIDSFQSDIHKSSAIIGDFTYSTMHNMSDIKTKLNSNTDIMNHKTPENSYVDGMINNMVNSESNQDISDEKINVPIKPIDVGDNHMDDKYGSTMEDFKVRTKSISPWARKR
jgi:hypothetical protein